MNLKHRCLAVSLLAVALQSAAAPIVKGSVTADPTKAGSNVLITNNGQASVNTPPVESEQKLQKIDRLNFSAGLEYQYKQDAELHSYLRWKKTRTTRLHVMPNGKARFRVMKGPLKDNLEALIKDHTFGDTYFPKNFPSSMRLYNDFFLEGENVLDIVNQLLDPFRITNNAHAVTHPNQIVAFTASVSY